MKENKKHLAIIGLGNQAKAWALNLRDSHWDVAIFTRPSGHGGELAKKLGFKSYDLGAKLKDYSHIALLIPDDQHLSFLEQNGTFIQKGARLIYAHGHSLSRTDIAKKFKAFTHLLLAPKAIASELRFHYQTKQGLGAVYSVEFAPEHTREQEQSFLLGLAHDLGISSGPYPCTVAQETNADLLSEQGLLCGLIPYACLSIYQAMREKDIPKEVAYFEAWHECKLITNTLMKVGPDVFFEMISPNALLGSYRGREAIVNTEFKNAISKLLADILNGNFDRWVANNSLQEIKREILEEWQHEELTQVHHQLAKELYGE